MAHPRRNLEREFFLSHLAFIVAISLYGTPSEKFGKGIFLGHLAFIAAISLYGTPSEKFGKGFSSFIVEHFGTLEKRISNSFFCLMVLHFYIFVAGWKLCYINKQNNSYGRAT